MTNDPIDFVVTRRRAVLVGRDFFIDSPIGPGLGPRCAFDFATRGRLVAERPRDSQSL